MPFLELLLVALALAMDAFAVALSTAAWLRHVDAVQTLRMASCFGFFQFAMPIVGWLAGERFAVLIADVDHWVAFGLLAAVGGRMLWAALASGQTTPRGDVTRGLTLLGLAVATSIDALAVGLSLAMVGEAIVFPSIVIGLVAGLMTVVGLQIGARFPPQLGRGAELTGGILLIAIGARILAEHSGLL